VEQCTLAVEGMTCGACSGAVERALAAVLGVTLAAVDLLSNRAQVRRRSGAAEQAVAHAVAAAGRRTRSGEGR
jgi:Cu+-exporting ATPase